jgi:hypothetical protein
MREKKSGAENIIGIRGVYCTQSISGQNSNSIERQTAVAVRGMREGVIGERSEL